MTPTNVYDFYAIAALPKAFYDRHAIWNSRAQELVMQLAQEYAKELRRICITEAQCTAGSRTPKFNNVHKPNVRLSTVAKYFHNGLGSIRHGFGGPLWGYAAEIGHEIHTLLKKKAHWYDLIAPIDIVHSLEHNGGCIFLGKCWPGEPGNWINKVLNIKATPHALTWMRILVSPRIRLMLRTYEAWATRNGLTPLDLYALDNVAWSEQQSLKRAETHIVKTARAQARKAMLRRFLAR